MPANGLIADIDNPLGNGLLHLAASLAKARASRQNTDDWVAEQAQRRADRDALWKREDGRRSEDQSRRQAEDLVRAWNINAQRGVAPPASAGEQEHPLAATLRPALMALAAERAKELQRGNERQDRQDLERENAARERAAMAADLLELRNRTLDESVRQHQTSERIKAGDEEEKLVTGNVLRGAARTRTGGLGAALAEALGVDEGRVGTRVAVAGSTRDMDKKLKLANELLDSAGASEEEKAWANGVRREFMGLPKETVGAVAGEDAAGAADEPGFLSLRRTGAPGKWSLGDVLSMRWLAPETLGLNEGGGEGEKPAEAIRFVGDEPDDWRAAGINRPGMESWLTLAGQNPAAFQQQMKALAQSNPARYAAIYRAIKGSRNNQAK